MCQRMTYLRGLQGFEEEVMSILRRRYPPSMMLDLQSFSQATLQDMRDAFPDEVSVPSVSLQKFLQVFHSVPSPAPLVVLEFPQ